MFNEFHPDLVHFHSIGPIGYPTLKAAKHLRIPTIATLHGIPQFITAYTPWLTKTSKKNTHRALWLVLRNYYNQMQYITAPSQFASNQMREHGVTPPITVLPMWIDKPVLPINSQSVRKKFSLPKGHYIFLYIGRIDRDKNLLVALLAAEKLKHIASSFRIVFAGKGSYLPALKNLTNKRSLSDVISWIGYIEESDKFNFYRQADSFIMPSSVETQSLTTLEAIQSGLPVIIANAGALPEIEHQFGEQCTLFQYNDPNELARVMAHQLHVNSKIYSPHLFKSYYSKNYHIRSLEGLYKKLINVK